ncbi:hypothetical protein X767_20760 [Mesorhizobium sp. LSJC264A00]|nr:hypothetical protein X767_20760 [Mesorhizobium sp. LSJC264A00]
MSDDELAEFAFMRDGRWSSHTKALLRRFKTSRLSLNRGWAATWYGWACPCCNRTKPQFARLNSAGVLLCELEVHHDHLADRAGRLFEELNPLTDDKEFAVQRSKAKSAMLQFVERFDRTPVCIDCNLADNRAKALIGEEVDRHFTFSPREIATFIVVTDNHVHGIDVDKAHEIWTQVKPDFEDRLDFAERMGKRFANGKNRRESAPSRVNFWMDEPSVVWEQFCRATPGLGNSVGWRVIERSVSRDAVGKSAKRKDSAPGRPPTDAEYAGIEVQNRGQKHWPKVGEDWTCGCCKRTKRQICRKSRNSGEWTAKIHVLYDWIVEEDPTALYWRGAETIAHMVIGNHIPVLVCQDCRHVQAEVCKLTGLSSWSLTIQDTNAAISSVAPHQMHEADYELAKETAANNRELVAAVEEYHEHEREARARLGRAKWLTRLHRCSFDEVCDTLAYEYAEPRGIDLDEGQAYLTWLLAEAQRFERLRALE